MASDDRTRICETKAEVNKTCTEVDGVWAGSGVGAPSGGRCARVGAPTGGRCARVGSDAVLPPW